MTSLPLAAKNPTVGGAAMYPTRTIVENAVNSKDLATLVAAVKAAGSARITIPNLMQANGVIHIIDRVPMP